MDIQYYLETIDLSKKEAKIYTALLPHDELSIQEVAKNAKINRTTIYPLINGLISKGLVGQRRLGKKVHYFAESPERLAVYLADKKAKLTAQEEQLKDIIPQLKSRSVAKGAKPIVKIYEGRDGIIDSTRDFFNSDENGGIARMVYPKDKIEELFSVSEIKKLKNKRLAHKIQSKAIYTSHIPKLKTDKTGERIWLSNKDYPNITCDFSIYRDKVRIHTLGRNLSSIFIQNADVADTLAALFDIAFNRINKKTPQK